MAFRTMILFVVFSISLADTGMAGGGLGVSNFFADQGIWEGKE